MGIWPLTSPDRQNGIILVARRQDTSPTSSLDIAETLMNICAFQISNALDALLNSRMIQEKIKEIDYQIRLYEMNEKELLNEARLRLNLIDNIAVGIFVVSSDRTILRVNRRIEHIFGYLQEELIGQSSQLIHISEESFHSFGNHYQYLFDTESGLVTLEFPLRKKDGTVFMAASSGTWLDPQDPTKGVIWTIEDISGKLALEDQLKFLAHHDVLTGLPNRSVLESHLRMATERAVRQNQFFALGVLDLDNFKPVNDTYGHPAGDQLLKIIAVRLRDALRMNDLLVRLGGDEFVVVIENIHYKEDMEPVIKRLQKAIEAPIQLQFQDDEVIVSVGASLGLVLYPDTLEEPDAMLRKADQVLYRVKALKDNRARWWALYSDMEYENLEVEDILPYGKRAEETLIPVLSLLQKIQYEWLMMFDEIIIQSSDFKNLFQDMECEEWTLNHAQHLGNLFSPHLNELDHRNLAEKLGHSLACFGIEWVKVFDLQNRRMVHLEELMRHHHIPWDVAHILIQRLRNDAERQVAGYYKIDMQRLHILTDIDSMVWETHKWSELANKLVNQLVKLDEITSVAIVRPDIEGKFLFEYVAGEGMQQYIQALETSQVSPVYSHPFKKAGLGPTGRAWRYGSIQRSFNCITDESMSTWRDFVIEHQWLSMVAIPLLAPNGHPFAVLSIYSHYPGGFNSPTQLSMMEHVQKIIELRIESILKNEPNTLSSASHRRINNHTWENRLVMYYQPIVSLQTGELAKVEALARLQEDDGKLQLPHEFLPLLTEDGLFKLFQLGLEQGCNAIQEWLAEGIGNKLTLNLPPANLIDDRYPNILKFVLQQFDIKPSQFILEILNTEKAEIQEQVYSALKMFNQMGIQFAESDPDSGYGSLLRQHQLPIRMIKMNPALINELKQDPISIFTFIFNITNAAHALGKQVIVEGLETWSHVEIAYILGANYGQGYGIAKPMKKEKLVPWTKSFEWRIHPDTAETALGALAGYWRWVMEKKYLLSHHSSSLLMSADEKCILESYIKDKKLKGTKLDSLHKQIHAAMDAGHTHQLFDAHRQLVSIMLEKIEDELDATPPNGP